MIDIYFALVIIINYINFKDTECGWMKQDKL